MRLRWMCHGMTPVVRFYPPLYQKGGKPNGIDRPDYRYRRALRPLSGPPYKPPHQRTSRAAVIEFGVRRIDLWRFRHLHSIRTNLSVSSKALDLMTSRRRL